MSLDFCIGEEELRKALKLIEAAKRGGYSHTLAVFEISQAGKRLDDCLAVSDGSVVLKAHPTDSHQNWGRAWDPEDHIVVDGVSRYRDELAPEFDKRQLLGGDDG
jgi:hypothetical protein